MQKSRPKKRPNNAIKSRKNAHFFNDILFFTDDGPEERRQNAINSCINAHLGKVSHQFDFGRLYRHGCGVNKDIHEAIKWLLKAQKAGLQRSEPELVDIFRGKRTLSEVEKKNLLDQYRNQVGLDNTV